MIDSVHHFSDAVYANEMRIPAGVHVGKHVHDYSHLSILAFGQVIVKADGRERMIIAPDCIEIKAGIEHEIIAITDAVWYCVHKEIS